MNDTLADATRWWWIRHAPVSHLSDRIYGSMDPHCDVSDSAAFSRLASCLPREAIWLVTNLRRTTQTAEAIGAAGYPLPTLTKVPSFAEQDFGELHGRLHTEHASARTDPYVGFWPTAPEENAPGGESFTDVVARVRGAVNHLSNEHRGRDIVCVSHGGAIKAACSIALELHVHSAVTISIANLSLTRLHRLNNPCPGAPEWRVLGIGERTESNDA